jgi:hypothetical protein
VPLDIKRRDATLMEIRLNVECRVGEVGKLMEVLMRKTEELTEFIFWRN